jgi:hypothetical protein
MLSIIMLITVATTFSRVAYDKDLNRYLWGTIGVLSYFSMQIIAGVVCIIFMPELLQNKIITTILDLSMGLLGVTIAYQILIRRPNPNDTPPPASGDLLDSDL